MCVCVNNELEDVEGIRELISGTVLEFACRILGKLCKTLVRIVDVPAEVITGRRLYCFTLFAQ